MTVINVQFSTDKKLITNSDTFIFIANSKAGLIADFTDETVEGKSLFANLELHDISILKRIVRLDILNEKQDDPSSCENFIVREDGTSIRIILSVLPHACARGNTPSRAHAVSTIMKKYPQIAGNLSVVLLGYTMLDCTSLVYAQAIAVGRNFHTYSKKATPLLQNQTDIVIHAKTEPFYKNLITNITNTIKSIRLTQHIVDMPPNELHCSSYVIIAQEVVARMNRPEVKINVIQGHDLETQGFGGLWGVGKAAEHLPALVILSYIPPGTEGTPSICMVGKGIVYDTGGLSIKVPPNMAGMKNDMGGSAAVLGAFEAAVASNQLEVPLHALLCIAENAVGPLATRPDDVHTLLSGKTVEVNNTDAEGRLVLADGCFYAARTFNPSYIIDMATLTGAQLIATGKNHGALYCNDDELEAAVIMIGKNTGDLVHPLPYVPEFYRQEFSSPVADMKNSVADRGNAQSSCAGQFIGNHIEDYLTNGGKWCHIDMAGPVAKNGRATGYGVALLSNLAQRLSKEIYAIENGLQIRSRSSSAAPRYI